jgi:hypothetical protein
MYDDFRHAIQDHQKMTGKDHDYAVTWLVVYCVLFILRYVVTGVVVFALGRRIIAAFAVAIKESQSKENAR